MNSENDFVKYIKRHKSDAKVPLYLDIETYQYNEKAGRKTPTLYKNCTYSVAVSWVEDDLQIKKTAWSSFQGFFEAVFRGCVRKNNKNKVVAVTKQSNRQKKRKKETQFQLIFHNGNKYDNHFMRKDLLYFYPEIEVTNMLLDNALTNDFTVDPKEVPEESKQTGILLEKRVKSSNNLAFELFLKGLHFVTVDSWVKTNMSIATIGKKLKDLGLVCDDELKTDYNYTKYNQDDDMLDFEAYRKADEIFRNLSPDELHYIENDVILLAKAVLYYDELFPGFSFKKMTFTSNILTYYNTNDLTSFQLLNQVGQGKQQTKLQYTDYQFQHENFYDYLKPYYRGGMNFYNEQYLEKILFDCFSIDINSSYPYVMYAFDIPTFLVDFGEYDTPQEIETHQTNHYFLYRLSKDDFNTIILSQIKSRIVTQMLVKYYSTNHFVNINSYTLKTIENITGVTFEKLPVYSWLEYECVPFGSRKEIAENYFIKTQGKAKTKIIMDSPMEYTVTDIPNEIVFSQEEINNSKVKLNGLYGIPALRAYFNLFRLMPDGNYENQHNGYKNNERNLLFSVFVTSVAFYNLTSPFHYLTPEEIDENFIYCDTDSLYLKKAVYNHIPDSFYDPISLGKWDVEHETIDKMLVLNHKKYTYLANDKITVKCGGIDLRAFDTDMPFEEFISTQFHHGATIKNTKSIFNKQQTISIYESETVIERGSTYPTHFSQFIETAREKLLDRIREETDGILDDAMYIESEIGTFSQADLFPVKNQTEGKQSLKMLKIKNARMKNLLESRKLL